MSLDAQRVVDAIEIWQYEQVTVSLINSILSGYDDKEPVEGLAAGDNIKEKVENTIANATQGFPTKDGVRADVRDRMETAIDSAVQNMKDLAKKLTAEIFKEVTENAKIVVEKGEVALSKKTVTIQVPMQSIAVDSDSHTNPTPLTLNGEVDDGETQGEITEGHIE